MNAKKIIAKRKELWTKHRDIDKDIVYREAIADYLVSDKAATLRKEIKNNPEYLVEMFYVIVDKDQQTVPFFLNEVQQELIDKINKDIDLFKQGKKLHLKYLLLKGRQQG